MESLINYDTSINQTVSVDTVRILTDTLFVNSNGIVKVQTVSDSSFDTAFWISIITTAIAILTTTLLFWDRIKKPELSGKIISLALAENGSLTTTDIKGNPISFSGIKYFFKISLNVIHKNIFYSDVNVHVKYPNDEKSYKGRFYYSNSDNWTFGNTTKTLSIPQDKYITFNNVLEKDKTIFLYASFFIERPFEHFSELEFTFISPDGKSHKVGPLKSSDFSTERALFENEIWK